MQPNYLKVDNNMDEISREVWNGRVWRSIRALLFLPVFYFIWAGMPWWAFSFLSIVLLMGWYTNFQMKYQDAENPYNLVWIHAGETSLSLMVLGYLLYRKIIETSETPVILAIGCGFLFVRLVVNTLYHFAMAKDGSARKINSFWAKIPKLAINLTMMLYVLDEEHFQEIFMVSSILIMFASSLSLFYNYYRDPNHRKPLSVASQLTVSRIVLTPIFIWVFFYDSDLVYHNNNLIFKSLALIMVVTFMVTDFLDGYLARKWGEVSTLGKYLDPFSDKISNMTIFLCFMASDYANIWMVALIYFREASVETLRTLAASQNIIMPARQSGKWKTAIQGVGIVIILAGALNPVHQLIPNWDQIWSYLPQTVMSFITIITVLSGIDYFYHSRDVLKKFL
jgi:CDP-diacylglycerol--glycerol-3-phosphate 3-phosphatidyltransferase